MTRIFGLLFCFAAAISVGGCGGNEGGNMIENEEQSAVEAYEASLLEEEESMSKNLEESE